MKAQMSFPDMETTVNHVVSFGVGRCTRTGNNTCPPVWTLEISAQLLIHQDN